MVRCKSGMQQTADIPVFATVNHDAWIACYYVCMFILFRVKCFYTFNRELARANRSRIYEAFFLHLL